MPKPTQAARAVIKEQRRLHAIEHLGQRIDYLSSGKALSLSPTLVERNGISKAIQFLTQVRTTTIRNLDRSRGDTVAPHITQDMLKA